jgi:ABC-2 type transport system permease protein
VPRLRPGGWAWLLAHELRLWWRGGMRSRLVMALLVLLLLAMHALGWFAMARYDGEALMARFAPALILASAFVFTMVLSIAFGLAVTAVFERGDLDLLLSSPVDPARVQSVRGMGVAISSVALLLFAFVPFLNMGVARGHWRLALVYPVALAGGMAATALAMAATLWLVRLLGARRARVVSQLLGAFVGAVFLILMQGQNLLPAAQRKALAAYLASNADAGWLGPHSVLAWPARAMLGDPVAALAVIALGIAAYVVLMRLTADLFSRTAQAGPEVVAPRRAARARAFRAGVARSIVRKELVLIARDPVLISKSLLQVLYLVPLFVVLVQHDSFATALAPAVVFLAAGLAGNLAWITMSGEEAPDLLGAAPVDREHVLWLKCAAALAPVAAIVSPILGWYVAISPRDGLFVGAYVLAACTASALMQVWTAKPGSSRDFKTRGRENPVVAVVEVFTTLAWGFACFLTLRGSWGVLPAIAVGLFAPGIAWLKGRRDAARLA